jgi:prepilin-type N-terminal cleavage/methylation domain-containing protein
MKRTHFRRTARGFSLVELLIVVTVSLVVAAVAIPTAVTATQDMQLRGTASSFAGVVQKARMYSVAQNSTYPVAATTATVNGESVTTVSVTLPASDTGNSQLKLPRKTTIAFSGSGLSDTTLRGSVTTAVYNTLPQFNARGLPCFVSGGVCSTDTSKIYITYLSQTRTFGGTGWAAITVTPAGRVQVWTWNGSAWH